MALLTADAFLEILDDSRVVEKFHKVFDCLIDMMVEEKVKAVKQDIEASFKKIFEQKDRELEELKAEVDLIKSEQSKSLQYSYREDLIVKGLKIEQTNADAASNEASPDCLKSTVLSVFNDKMNVKVEKSEISTVHFLGKPNKDNRNVIVRFVNRDTKTTIFKNKKSLQGKNIYIEEHLTPENSKLLYEARQLKKQKLIESCWTNNCVLYMRLLDGKVKKFDKMTDIDTVRQTKRPAHNLRQRPSRLN